MDGCKAESEGREDAGMELVFLSSSGNGSLKGGKEFGSFWVLTFKKMLCAFQFMLARRAEG